MKKFLVILLTLFIFSSCGNEEPRPQYNEWLTGTWYFNQTEYITFYDDDVFIMNDTIQGAYDVQDDNDVDVWYYWVSINDEELFDTGIMHCDKKTMKVTDLPTHKGTIIQIYRKK